MPSTNHISAPSPDAQVNEELRKILFNLYSLQLMSYEYGGPQSASNMSSEVRQLVQNLQSLATSSSAMSTAVPQEILEYVENGRNPDIYTREFVELVQRANQSLKGKTEGFKMFGDILAQEISGGVPALSADVGRVMANRSTNG